MLYQICLSNLTRPEQKQGVFLDCKIENSRYHKSIIHVYIGISTDIYVYSCHKIFTADHNAWLNYQYNQRVIAVYRLERRIINADIAAGVTPGILDPCARVSGRILSSFSRTSVDRFFTAR